ncbi:flagellar biosynthesis anti-sigma factor FlgM [Methylomonas rapida]|uniref:Negative regulator of flagellin synthesis n=1 Tax=Methylomonas rapida TaxID=2963939 RepID=A0ABY7GGD6_9GAMM|nr:flagellar biosynthesis anti-sigma factor FlgM [Methylomonas rapida]WAR44027.1 flagellar biosynthesis anti-sigma factor FlgM [Methylomonas rapida]
MAIQSVNTGNVTSAVAQPKVASKSTIDNQNQPSHTVSSDDTVNLKTIERTASSTPIVDEAKVNEIKVALSSGSYAINPERIASKMMQLDFNLPNTT